MSKKHLTSSHQTPAVQLSHAEEYRIIQHDLIRVALLNALYLAAVLVLFMPITAAISWTRCWSAGSICKPSRTLPRPLMDGALSYMV